MSVYFVATECGRFVKIGRTRHLEKRIDALRCASPMPLVVLQVLPGHARSERIYHETFADRRAHREWFRADEDMLRFIAETNADWSCGDVDP